MLSLKCTVEKLAIVVSFTPWVALGGKMNPMSQIPRLTNVKRRSMRIAIRRVG